MNLPKLLRRLDQSAHSRDARALGETLNELARNTGWNADVAAFLQRLPEADRAFVNAYLNPTTPSAYGGAAGGDNAGGTRARVRYPYPSAPDTMANACGGFGVWQSGWRFNAQNGNIDPLFGAPTLVAASSPVYGIPTPVTPDDRAMQFDSAADALDGGANFDIGANDLCLAFVGNLTSLPGLTGNVAGKVSAGIADGYSFCFDGASQGFLAVVDGGGLKTTIISIPNFVGRWTAYMACVDRSTGFMRCAGRTLDGLAAGTSAQTAVAGNITTASNFIVGADAWVGPTLPFQISALWIGTGVGAATGMSANLTSALSSFVASLARGANT